MKRTLAILALLLCGTAAILWRGGTPSASGAPGAIYVPSRITDIVGLQNALNNRLQPRRTAFAGLNVIATRGSAIGNGTYSNPGTDTGMTSRFAHQSAQTLCCIRVAYANWSLAGSNTSLEASPGNPVTFAASIEYPSGTKYRLYFNGQASVTIADGGEVLSDALYIAVPANTRFWTNTYVSCLGSAGTVAVTNGNASVTGTGSSFTAAMVGQPMWFASDQTNIYTVASVTNSATLTLTSNYIGTTNASTKMGQRWYFQRQPITGNGENTNAQYAGGSGADLTAPGSAAPTGGAAGTFAVGPTAIVGTTGTANFVSVVAVGDSLIAGIGRASSSTGNVGSFFERGLGNSFGFLNIGQASSRLRDFATTPGSYRNRLAIASACDYVVCNWGINDCAANDTLATVEANAIAMWKALGAHGNRVIQTTLCPSTTSTDSWATTANQTPRSYEAVRTGFNSWLRDGAPMSGGVAVATGTVGALRSGQTGHPLYLTPTSGGDWDIASAVEVDASGMPIINGGRWAVGSVYLTDAIGIHLSDTGHTSAAAKVNTAKLVAYMWN